jgi:ring-1,2-phenylacetyl-CoA epoxidase subunit PaaE
MSRFYPLTVSKVHRETRDSVVLTFDVPLVHKELFRFIQGQYLTLRADIEGEETRRSYSVCAGTNERQPRVGIKKVTGGLFSTWANNEIAPGQMIEAMPPAGNFYVPLDPANRRHYLGFAAGSGITPLLSIIKSTLIGEPRSQFTLFYGNRASSTIMFREELEDLKSEFLHRFSLIHILSREQQDVELFNGRIDREKCDQLLAHWVEPKSVDTAFICGPQSMMLQVADSLQARGIDRQQIKFELFAAGEPNRRRRLVPEAATNHADLCEATIIIDGRARTFTFEKNTVGVLDAAVKEGMELPYACKAGVCSTCRAMLIEGQVDMDANFSLEDYEIARGYILTCQSYPATDRIVIDFDK